MPGTYQYSNMASQNLKLGLGVVALLVSSLVMLGTGLIETPLPEPMAAVAALGLAVGSVLVGLSEEGAGV